MGRPPQTRPTPGRVRRDFARLLLLTGTPASPPKPTQAGRDDLRAGPAPRHPGTPSPRRPPDNPDPCPGGKTQGRDMTRATSSPASCAANAACGPGSSSFSPRQLPSHSASSCRKLTSGTTFRSARPPPILAAVGAATARARRGNINPAKCPEPTRTGEILAAGQSGSTLRSPRSRRCPHGPACRPTPSARPGQDPSTVLAAASRSPCHLHAIRIAPAHTRVAVL